MKSITLLLSLIPCTFSLSTVVYGPQSRELLLLTAKIAAQQGLQASCICAPGTEEGCRRLLYGNDYAEAGMDEEGKAEPISDSQDMGAALAEATSMVLIGTDNPVEASTLETFLKYTDGEKLKKLVLISKMGVTTSGGGFFGGKNAELESEKALAQIAQQNNLDFSIVRTGILKGGGPGLDEEGKPMHQFGLDRAYYTTYLDVVEFKVAVAHDKFSLGADTTSVVKGDPNKMPNMMTQMGTKSSFDPSPTDTNRIVAAAAAVAALQDDVGPIEFSVGSAAGKQLPTPEGWKSLLQSIQ